MIDFVIVAFENRTAVAELILGIEHTVHVQHTITIIDNTLENRGWALACNLGSEHGAGELIAFVNPDVDLNPGWLRPVLHALHEDPALIVAGPRCIDGLAWPRKGQGMNAWVCGACMLVRRDWFDTNGGFAHEQFPHEFAETDLERRVEAQGLHVRTIESIAVRHYFVSAKSPQVLAWRSLGEANERRIWELA